MSTSPEQLEKEAAAFRALINNPEVGLEAKRLYKKAVPNARFPDLEAEDRLAAATKPLQDKIAAMEEQAIKDRVEQRRRENHQLVKDAGLDPAAVEKVMTDENIANYSTAIKYIQAQQKNVAPTPSNYQNPIQIQDGLKEIGKNPTAWARDQAHKAIDELKAKRQGM